MLPKVKKQFWKKNQDYAHIYQEVLADVHALVAGLHFFVLPGCPKHILCFKRTVRARLGMKKRNNSQKARVAIE